MATLNVRTRALSYLAADLRLLDSCVILLDAMSEFDREAANDDKAARNCVAALWTHVNKQRNGTAEKIKWAKPAAKTA